VVACNSATAAALPSLRRRMLETTLGVDVLGVVRPEASQAVAATRTGRIGLLATPTTVSSRAYEGGGACDRPARDDLRGACPGLAAIIQAGEQFDQRAVQTVREACEPLREADVDTVILGCTHYPLIRPMLQRMLGPQVELISSGAALARQVEHALSTRSLGNSRGGEGDYRFLCTGDTQAFEQLGNALSADAAGRGRARRACGSGGGGMSEPAPTRQLRPRRRASFARRRSSRASCARRPDRR